MLEALHKAENAQIDAWQDVGLEGYLDMIDAEELYKGALGSKEFDTAEFEDWFSAVDSIVEDLQLDVFELMADAKKASF